MYLYFFLKFCLLIKYPFILMFIYVLLKDILINYLLLKFWVHDFFFKILLVFWDILKPVFIKLLLLSFENVSYKFLLIHFLNYFPFFSIDFVYDLNTLLPYLIFANNCTICCFIFQQIAVVEHLKFVFGGISFTYFFLLDFINKYIYTWFAFVDYCLVNLFLDWFAIASNLYIKSVEFYFKISSHIFIINTFGIVLR